jgi:signal transduction histidine kinase
MSSTGGDQKELILAVDDTPANLHLLTGILLASGYAVRMAEDGTSALEMARSLPFDLILLDIQLPDFDGFEICKQLKADPATRDVPVIFISAFSDTENILRGFDLGGVDYITKPFQVKEVLARVATHLTIVRQRKQIVALRELDRQRYEMLDEMKNRFIQMATHDLRNPLNVILGYAVMLEGAQCSEDDLAFVRESAREIQKSTAKMRGLVTDILDLASMEARSALQLAPVSLTPFLSGCLKGFFPIANQKQIELIFQPPDDEVSVLLDAPRFERVMDNLVSNAIKYTPAGGLIEVCVHPDHDQVALEVSDTGLGIPDEDLPRLFEAFFRVATPEHLEVEGTGLGLSIVKSIVEQHGGKIGVTSQLGQGSTFTVSLPLIPVA